MREPPTNSKPRICTSPSKGRCWEVSGGTRRMTGRASRLPPIYIAPRLLEWPCISFTTCNKIFYIGLNHIKVYHLFSRASLILCNAFYLPQPIRCEVYSVYGACKRFKRMQRHRSLLEVRIRKVRYQDLLLLQLDMLRSWPCYWCLSEIRDYNNLVILVSASVRKDIVVLFIKKFKVTVDEDIFMRLSQL